MTKTTTITQLSNSFANDNDDSGGGEKESVRIAISSSATSASGSSKGSGSSLNYSSDINAISVELPQNAVNDSFGTLLSNSSNDEETGEHHIDDGALKYLPAWPTINLEFRDLVYSVSNPELTSSKDGGKTGGKQILRKINGQFRSHELTAIMGPSGAGKTTLLNILAGYGIDKTSGQIYVNSQERDLHIFRKMSRYIMQTVVLDKHFTVMELMMLAANLKLGETLTHEQKLDVINDILYMLRLKRCEHTKTPLLSGGEGKRLCVALELVNNPSVVFLDEPTTGLDDHSSVQCIGLLRRLAHAGRTIICSIHTPSARIFEMFDKVYVLTEGQCVYQGSGTMIVPFVEHIGLSCPLTYNPADFIIEVACREYGNYHDDMVNAIENGRVMRWTPEKFSLGKSDTTSGASSLQEIESFEEEINPKLLKANSSWWMQYRLLLNRMLLQMWRDKSYIKLKFFMNIAMALIVGGIFRDSGSDATKALFNIGFVLTIVIAYLYLPMMPVLLQFPSEMKLLKREYFNQWFHLSSYYVALLTSKLPALLFLATIYLAMVYLMTSQPLELFRFGMLYLIAILTAMASDSLGLLISSRLSLVNAMFMGPVIAVPLILLSCYGAGYGKEVYIPTTIRFLMSLSHLRHGMEGIIASLYGYERTDTICPETEFFCMFQKSQFLLSLVGFENLNYVYSVCCLIGFYLFFTSTAYILIRRRLKFSQSTNVIFFWVGYIFRKYFNFTSYKY